MQTLLLWLFYISSFYAFIPGLITRIFGFRVFRRGTGEHEFALTFDDGPDPIYTPKLLELLKRFDAKATFFVVGSHAEKYPELVKRMHDEGHLLGIHNYVHKSNWFMRPATVTKQIMKTDKIIHSITGERTSYYRPPWGIVNLFDLPKSRGNFKIVLWSAMFGDWRERIGADRLTERMLHKLQPGEVMLLHDCGMTAGANPNAPEQMLIALERVLEEAKERGLRSIRIDEMIKAKESSPEKQLSLGKRVLVKLWLIWERVFHVVYRLKTVHPQNPFLHYRLRSYKGENVTFEDGTVLEKGDKVVELHFDNEKLFRFGVRSRSAVQLAISMIRQMEGELPELAHQVMADENLRKAKALYGVSMINRGPQQFGFTVLDLEEGWFAKSTRFYLKILLSIIHPSGQGRLKEKSQNLVPKKILMPIDHLVGRFADHGSHRKSHEVNRANASSGAEEDEDILDLKLAASSQGMGS